jgi:hypothetical protein
MFFHVPFVVDLQGNPVCIVPHPFGSMFGSSTFIGNLVQILDCFIVLLVNVFRGSKIAIDNVIYLACHSSILDIFDMEHCIIYGV